MISESNLKRELNKADKKSVASSSSQRSPGFFRRVNADIKDRKRMKAESKAELADSKWLAESSPYVSWSSNTVTNADLLNKLIQKPSTASEALFNLGWPDKSWLGSSDFWPIVKRFTNRNIRRLNSLFAALFCNEEVTPKLRNQACTCFTNIKVSSLVYITNSRRLKL
jgi:hypothetical protein